MSFQLDNHHFVAFGVNLHYWELRIQGDFNVKFSFGGNSTTILFINKTTRKWYETFYWLFISVLTNTTNEIWCFKRNVFETEKKTIRWVVQSIFLVDITKTCCRWEIWMCTLALRIIDLMHHFSLKCNYGAWSRSFPITEKAIYSIILLFFSVKKAMKVVVL